MRKELENRLIKLALDINRNCKKLDNSFLSKHLTSQIIRSSTSSALNYGEAQAAESRKDFIHKVSLVLKELRETKICIILLSDNFKPKLSNNQLLEECDQLIAIFHKTIVSAKKNRSK